MDNYVIFEYINDIGEGLPLFWNNKDGWGSLESADVFTEAEASEFNLPIGGTWMRLPEIKEKEK